MIQQTGLFPHRTVEDNIATVPVLNGWPRKKARASAEELLTLVGLDPALAKRYPHQLSGGQQQRVGVARALAADPPVLLMDEPFSAVDPVVRASLQDELLSLQAELRKTIVLVTHDIEEAIKVGDLVALFRPHGKIAQLAPPDELLAAPVDDYVAGLCRLRPRHPAAVVRLHGGTDAWTPAPVLPADATVAQARAAGRAVDPASPRKAAARAAGSTRPRSPRSPGGARSRRCGPSGSATPFTVGTDSLRAALDAAVLSPAGQAVARGRRRAGCSASPRFDQLRAAIQAADGNSRQDTRQVQPAQRVPPS